tara:strand:- start:509 stop:694 length:186 start_codon:yes stop_codon:yes gene_type:complete
MSITRWLLKHHFIKIVKEQDDIKIIVNWKEVALFLVDGISFLLLVGGLILLWIVVALRDAP